MHLILALLLVSAQAAPKKPGKRFVPVTMAQCMELKQGIVTYGEAAVLVGARLRGYSPETIAAIRKACKI